MAIKKDSIAGDVVELTKANVNHSRKGLNWVYVNALKHLGNSPAATQFKKAAFQHRIDRMANILSKQTDNPRGFWRAYCSRFF